MCRGVFRLPAVPEYTLPPGAYFSLTRAVRAKNAGQTRALMARNRLFQQYAGITPTLLTFDAAPVYGLERQLFAERGELLPGMVLHNLFDFYREYEVRPEDFDAHHVGPDAAPCADSTPVGEPPVISGVRLVVEQVPHPDGSTYYTGYRQPETDLEVIRDYRRRDGSVYLRAPGPLAGSGSAPYTLVDRDNQPIVSWLRRRGWQRHWLLTLLGDAERAFLISDGRRGLNDMLPVPDERFRVIHVMHNVHTVGERRWNSPLGNTYGRLLASVSDLDGLVSLTERQRDDVAERLGRTNNLYAVSNPIVIPTPPDPRPLRATAHFAMVTRLTGQKQLDHAVRAFALVVAERPHARLDIYGTGSLDEKLQQLIEQLDLSDQVTLRGWDPDARDRLWTATGFLMTSGFEGYPLATLEAQARGCPVISYDIKYGPREQISDGVDGFLVEPGDLAAVAEKVIRLIDDPTLVHRMSTAALEKARTHDYRAFMAAWQQVLDSVEARRAKRVVLRNVTADLTELNYMPRRVPVRIVGRVFALIGGSASRQRPRLIRLDAVLRVRGDWPRGALKRARLTLTAVSKDSEMVTKLPLMVSLDKRTFTVSSQFRLDGVLAKSATADDSVVFRLRLVLANASWETTIKPPTDARPAP